MTTERTSHSSASLSRRGLLTASAGAAAFSVVRPRAVRGAQANAKIKLGLIGAGGRGSWIAALFAKHGGYQISAVADYFPKVAQAAGRRFGVDAKRCFSGLAGYKRLLAAGVDAVALETPPWVFPEHASAAVAAGCHVYMAKPIACDSPGCLTIAAQGKLAAQKKRVFLVDFQIRTDPHWIEAVKRVGAGALGKVSMVCSHYHDESFSDPPKTKSIADRFRRLIWVNDTDLGASYLVNAGIHAIDGALWLLGDQAPLSATGGSRRGRPTPHGDSHDTYSVTYEMPGGVLLSHRGEHIRNNNGFQCGAVAYGQGAYMEGHYNGKAFIRGGKAHYGGGDVSNLYAAGAQRNIALFHKCVLAGDCTNPTVAPSVNSTLTSILGREAAAAGTRLTMKALLAANKKLEVDTTGLVE